MNTEFHVGRYHDVEGVFACIYRRGRTQLHITTLASTGVRHEAAPLSEERHISALHYKGADYPLDRAVRKFRRIGRTLGITQAAKGELARAAGEVVS